MDAPRCGENALAILCIAFSAFVVALILTLVSAADQFNPGKYVVLGASLVTVLVCVHPALEYDRFIREQARAEEAREALSEVTP